eukprot:1216562-Pleurochrysis_carterae.AAC.1
MPRGARLRVGVATSAMWTSRWCSAASCIAFRARVTARALGNPAYSSTKLFVRLDAYLAKNAVSQSERHIKP